MPDEVLAQARRLHMHVMNGGNVTAMDMSRLVQGMERQQAERDQLREALRRIGAGNGCMMLTSNPPICSRAFAARTALGEERT